jgi:hypothetical protein
MCLALPIKSAITQRSSRNCVASTRRASSSPRRNPHPISKNGIVPLTTKRKPIHIGQQSLALVGCQHSYPAYSVYSSNSSSQFRTEQTGVGSLKGNPSDSNQSQVDGRWRVLLLFEKDSVP